MSDQDPFEDLGDDGLYENLEDDTCDPYEIDRRIMRGYGEIRSVLGLPATRRGKPWPPESEIYDRVRADELGGAAPDEYVLGVPEVCPGCGGPADWHPDRSGAGDICMHCGEYLHEMQDTELRRTYPKIGSFPKEQRQDHCPPELAAALRLPPVWHRAMPHVFQFYIGVKKPSWIMQTPKVARALEPTPIPVPGFITYRVFRDTATLYPAGSRWAMDSGGFTELCKYGGWHEVPPERYAADVQRLMQIGCMDFAAIQDWMCEPAVIHGGMVTAREKAAGTNLSVIEHQHRTIESYLRLRELAPEVPWMPVIQGFTIEEYYRCVGMYVDAGVSLRELQQAPKVGIGSVCRRQGWSSIASMLQDFRDNLGLKNMHGFGFKIQGLIFAARFLASADSMSWSLGAQNLAKKGVRPLGPDHRHGTGPFPTSTGAGGCQNCPDYAVRWRARLMEKIAHAYVGVGDAAAMEAIDYLGAIPPEWQDGLFTPQELQRHLDLGGQLSLFD